MVLKDSQPEFDVVIIGGGPAGLATALWCADLRMSSIVLERRDEFGGQLLSVYNAIKNYPGRETENGREMRDVFLSQVQQRKTELRTGVEIARVDPTGAVVDSKGAIYSARAIVIATGVSRRRLNIEGESDFYGKGIIESGQRDKEFVKDKRLLIVGGGDAALENALLLADVAAEVTVVIRKSAPSARAEFVDRVKGDRRVRFLFDSEVAKFSGGEVLSRASVKSSKSGSREVLDIDAALIRIGVEPNTNLLSGALDLDSRRYIKVDRECETSVPRIFAVGDVANPSSPTISTAAGMGSTAAKKIHALLNHK
ncbi:MAG TPA: NAD(P)/FAD-dependent oxidoreductase [Pyrinomonadaceae bacterium]|jgi:thioredoxin reductase (NADPH)|nr:NAD(P)/FAD-dependent oxidoreductase [Pyrinomonadaceae bacterium]